MSKVSKLSETDAAQTKLTDITARSTTLLAAIVRPDFKPGRSLLLFNQRFLCQNTPPKSGPTLLGQSEALQYTRKL